MAAIPKPPFFVFKPSYIVAVICPFIGGAIGWFLDKKETERMTLFRDKSALYGRELKPGEKPSWP